MHLVPNIETLELFWGGGDVKYTTLVLEKASKQNIPVSSPEFKNLHTVTIKILVVESANFSVRQLRPFLSIASLRRFNGQYMTIRDDEDHYDLFPAHLEIEHLEFKMSNGKEAWHPLIAACQNLKTFKFKHWTSEGRGPSFKGSFDNHFDPSNFLSALEAKSGEVEFLEFDIFKHRGDEIRGRIQPSDLDITWYGPLRGITTLKQLQINATNFMGFEFHPKSAPWLATRCWPELSLVGVLPFSLESLSISDMRDWTQTDFPRIIFELDPLVGSSRFSRSKMIGTIGLMATNSAQLLTNMTDFMKSAKLLTSSFKYPMDGSGRSCWMIHSWAVLSLMSTGPCKWLADCFI